MTTGDLESRAALTMLFDMPPSGIGVMMDQMNRDNLFRLEVTADATAQSAAYLSGYLTARGASGGEDQGHEAALKAANAKLTAVRKAMGYQV